MRLGSRNGRQGDRRNRQMFLKRPGKHPGVEPVFWEKAARCEWLKNFAYRFPIAALLLTDCPMIGYLAKSGRCCFGLTKSSNVQAKLFAFLSIYPPEQ